MDLTKRLLRIISYIEDGMSVADIGCDHGYVPIYLVKNGISPFAIAMDINKGPLEKAGNNAKAFQVGDKVLTRQSNGLSTLEANEVDCVVIAGMGGKLIESILDNDKHKLSSYKRLVLSPHKDIQSVREKLREVGFTITDEDMFEDEGHFYNIIIAEPIRDDEVIEEPIKNDKEEKIQKLYNKYGKILIESKNKCLFQQIEKLVLKQELLLPKLKEQGLLDRVSVLSEEIQNGREVMEWIKS